jgi:aspartate/methionine/tyrosine aminotransferase
VARFPRNDIISLIGPMPRYDLGESVGPDLSLSEVLGSSPQASFGDTVLGYGTAQGDPRLRALIADAYGASAGDVVVTVGGMHALFLVAFVVCDPGDEAVVVSPMFPLARNALQAVGATIRTVPLSFDRGYQIDAADVGRRLSERTKLVSLASPQNPSGIATSPAIVEDLVASMAERCPDAYLLLDETYREAAHGDDAVAPSAVGLSRRIISCASLSKCHGAPGLRLGWAIARDPALKEQLVVAKFNTVISCSPLDESLAVRVLERRDHILGERRRRLAQGLALTAGWVRENDAFVEWVRPDAGALCCVRLKPSVFDDGVVENFYETLAREGIRVANGRWFGDEARVFRLGFGLLPAAELEAALARLSAAMRRVAHAAQPARAVESD